MLGGPRQGHARMRPMAETRTLPAATRGRFLVEGDDRLAPLLVGFHGYGQNAEMLLEEMKRIPGAGAWTLVSVMALHRFYNTKTQEVVGSWMTKLDREQAIADNRAYVATVVDTLRSEGRTGRLVFLGFSQGAPMAWRAAASMACDGVITLGGDLPADVAAQASAGLPPSLIARGRVDGMYTDVQMEKDEVALRAMGVSVEAVTFEGGHGWAKGFCQAAGSFLERTRRA